MRRAFTCRTVGYDRGTTSTWTYREGSSPGPRPHDPARRRTHAGPGSPSAAPVGPCPPGPPPPALPLVLWSSGPVVLVLSSRRIPVVAFRDFAVNVSAGRELTGERALM